MNPPPVPVRGQPEAEILDAWDENAAAWERAVREARIESRRLVTDRALLDAVADRAPASVLDAGCGEGWLGRELAARGIETFGVDAVPALVDSAERARPGWHATVSYSALASHRLERAPFDLAVCNFSLLGDASVRELLCALHVQLGHTGALVVQTLHPDVVATARPAEYGWRTGSWAGCGTGFGRAAPWYYRTRDSWRALLAGHGFPVVEEREPAPAPGAPPCSIIFACVLAM